MLTQERLKEILDYNSETGIFVWIKLSGRRASIGDIAGSFHDGTGYIRIGIDGKNNQAHRLAWLYVYGDLPLGQIDHINHIRTDNRIENLRAVSSQENSRNCVMRSANTSGFTGVYWSRQRNKWKAQIMIDGKCIYLGSFTTISEAITARSSANHKYGFHRNHGQNHW
ncbi:MAG: HNH endonuclease [Deltaproteobacteria bacterium]|nr:HNH endonuclease [Deltaproteobacteria bacterium]